MCDSKNELRKIDEIEKRVKVLEEKINNKDDNKYPSSARVLEGIKSEYEHEYARTNSFRNRVGILFPFISGLIIFMFQDMRYYQFKKIFEWSIRDTKDILLVIMILSVYLLSIGLMLLSLYFSMKVFKSAIFERPSLDTFSSENSKFPLEITEVEYIDIYCKATRSSEKTNNKIEKSFSKVINFLSSAVIINIIVVFIRYFLFQ